MATSRKKGLWQQACSRCDEEGKLGGEQNGVGRYINHAAKKHSKLPVVILTGRTTHWRQHEEL